MLYINIEAATVNLFCYKYHYKIRIGERCGNDSHWGQNVTSKRVNQIESQSLGITLFICMPIELYFRFHRLFNAISMLPNT